VNRAARGAPARGPHAATLACVVFATLVLASVAALFYAQVLKREAPLLLPPAVAMDVFEPSGPGVHPPREAHFRVRTSVDDVLDIAVLKGNDRQVAVIATGLPVHKYQHATLHWDGRTTAGKPAPPGIYLIQVRFSHAGQTVIQSGFQLHLQGPAG
jgi:hypothetical protein